MLNPISLYPKDEMFTSNLFGVQNYATTISYQTPSEPLG